MSELSYELPVATADAARRSASGPERQPTARALFVDDEELRRRINPKMGRDSFLAAVRAAEQQGFPKKDSLWGGRYWPAAQAWLDSYNGLAKNEFCPHAEDGPEQF
jgi:hypothetical protein